MYSLNKKPIQFVLNTLRLHVLNITPKLNDLLRQPFLYNSDVSAFFNKHSNQFDDKTYRHICQHIQKGLPDDAQLIYLSHDIKMCLLSNKDGELMALPLESE